MDKYGYFARKDYRYYRNKHNLSIGVPSAGQTTLFSIDTPGNVSIMDVREALKENYLAMKRHGEVEPSVLVKMTCQNNSWGYSRFPLDFAVADISDLEHAGREEEPSLENMDER